MTATRATPASDRNWEEEMNREALFARAAERTAGGQEMHLLTAVLKTALGIAKRFTDCHDGECRCGFCTGGRYYRGLAYDVEGMSYSLAMFESVLSSNLTADTDALTGNKTFGHDLRRLAELSDNVDGLILIEEEEAEADEADTPAVVRAG